MKPSGLHTNLTQTNPTLPHPTTPPPPLPPEPTISHTPPHQLLSKSPLPISVGKVIIRKVNIYESPILTAKYYDKTVYIVLDMGAQTSLISKAKADLLNMKIYSTRHTAVQIDGVTDLKVLGEVHCSFIRSNIELFFDALVVNKMGANIEILGGANFHKENDVWPRMWDDTITLKGTVTVPSASPTLLALDSFVLRTNSL